MILTFPKRPAKPGRRKSSQALQACIHGFPRARNARIVKSIATIMLEIAAKVDASTGADPMDAAETALIEFLEIDWDYYSARGVADIELEAAVRGFATAAWAEFMRQRYFAVTGAA